MPNTIDDRIVILDIDERSLAAEGHHPWQRDKYVNLMNILFDEYGVRVVAFDILFAETDEASALEVIRELRQMPEAAELPVSWEDLEHRWQTDSQFAESIIARDVILGYVFKPQVRENEDATSGSLPLPTIFADQLVADGVDIPLYKAAGYVGSFTELQDATEFGAFFSYPRLDDVTRASPLLQEYQGDVYESLGMAMARLYLGNPPLQFQFAEGEQTTGLNLEFLVLGDRRIPVDEKAQVYIPFLGPQGSFPYVSITDVLNRRVSTVRLRDKLILIGTSAAGLLDLRATPVAEASSFGQFNQLLANSWEEVHWLFIKRLQAIARAAGLRCSRTANQQVDTKIIVIEIPRKIEKHFDRSEQTPKTTHLKQSYTYN